MPSITFAVDENGETSLVISGIKGAACAPIHVAISDDLSSILGIPEMTVTDTPEAKERPPQYTTVQTARARR